MVEILNITLIYDCIQVKIVEFIYFEGFYLNTKNHNEN